ncbi:phasin family protein [Pseudoalteromonas sp. T1lg65]|uniref:phasin family protein n=1 Tax=Pseudoalteromonas sp. T1lg65 TaxID=2077101 RepID=UPI003F7A01DB
MYTDLFKTFNEQTEKFFSPAIQFNQLIAKNIEELAKIQLNTTEQITKTSVDQLKLAAEVKDAKSLMDFNASQINALNALSQQMIQDGQKLTQLGQEFRDKLEAMGKETVKAAQP